MKKQIKKVAEFHKLFKIGNQKTIKSNIGENIYNLRYNLMNEENNEYLIACKNNDFNEIADALGDQLYILFGTILKHGLQDKIENIFDEIHRSNLSKLDESGNPIFRHDGKILKSGSYFKPDISKILK